MTPDDEQLIERFLRRPDGLSDEDRRAVERMLDRDEAAQAYAASLSAFYEFLDEEREREPAPQVSAFVEDLFSASPPSVVPVRPFRPKRSSRPTVLAAATAASADERRFSVLTTLAADDEDLLVRIVGDREAEQGRLYVLSDASERQAHTVVSFPGLGLDLVTGENGQLAFDLPPEIDPDEWEKATAVVRRPLDTKTIASGETVTLDGPSVVPVRCRWAEGTLRASATAGEASVPSFLTLDPIGGEGDDPVLLRLRGEEAVQMDVPTQDECYVRLYG